MNTFAKVLLAAVFMDPITYSENFGCIVCLSVCSFLADPVG